MTAPKRAARRKILSAPNPDNAPKAETAPQVLNKWLLKLKLEGKSLEEIHKAYCQRTTPIKLKSMKEKLRKLERRAEENRLQQAHARANESVDDTEGENDDENGQENDVDDDKVAEKSGMPEVQEPLRAADDTESDEEVFQFQTTKSRKRAAQADEQFTSGDGERPSKRRLINGVRPQVRASPSKARLNSAAHSTSKPIPVPDSELVDITKDANYDALSPLSTISSPAKTPAQRNEKDEQARSTKKPESYETFVRNKLPAINQTLDASQHEIAEEYNRTTQLLDQRIPKLFSHLNDEGIMEGLSQRFARHLKLSLTDVAHMISGADGPAGLDRLQTGLNPSVSFIDAHSYPGDTLVRAVFWGIITTRIYHQDLLYLFEFPGSHERVQRDEGHYREYLADESEDLAARHRFMYRDMRLKCIKKPQYQSKIDAYAESVFLAFEEAVSVLFGTERSAFAPNDRATFFDAIRRAIVLKCRVDMSHYKCEWRWAPMNAMFQDEWMQPEASKRESSRTLGRHINRVCFAYSPAVIMREPDDGNLGGRERWETSSVYIKGNRRVRQERESEREMIEKAGEEDDGSNGWRTVVLKAEVCTFDGPLSKPGPEWPSRPAGRQ